MHDNKILESAKLVIVGAICGDIIGSTYEFDPTDNYDFDLLPCGSSFTDDTVCTIAIADAIVKNIPFDKSLQCWCRKYPYAGYGGMFCSWIVSDDLQPYNSFGNGSAMRISPVGAVAKTFEETLNLAQQTAEITHNHPEGIKGAQAVAAAIFWALRGVSKSAIRLRIEENFEYDLSSSYEQMRAGYGFNETCQGSIPQSIVSFLDSYDYESAVRKAVYMGGDADTMGAIAGAIAAAFYGHIPSDILHTCLNLLPKEMIAVIDQFNRKLL